MYLPISVVTLLSMLIKGSIMSKQRQRHLTTIVLREALDLNRMSCNRIYNYDGIKEVNSKAWVLSNKSKLARLKKTIAKIDPSMEMRVTQNHRGTSLRVVQMKEAV